MKNWVAAFLTAVNFVFVLCSGLFWHDHNGCVYEDPDHQHTNREFIDSNRDAFVSLFSDNPFVFTLVTELEGSIPDFADLTD